MTAEAVRVEVFTDVLCIWAYGGQARLDQLRRDFGDRVSLEHRFIPLFGAARSRIERDWAGHGGYAGFNRHLREVASDWSHVRLHPELWLDNRPASSTLAHLYIKAAQRLEHEGRLADTADRSSGRSTAEEYAWRIRCAFFADNRDIGRPDELERIAGELGLPPGALREEIAGGEAPAALHRDTEARDEYLVPGSPTLVFNAGRQRLYGNVGYRIIEANIRELFRDPQYGEASWC